MGVNEIPHIGTFLGDVPSQAERSVLRVATGTVLAARSGHAAGMLEGRHGGTVRAVDRNVRSGTAMERSRVNEIAHDVDQETQTVAKGQAATADNEVLAVNEAAGEGNGTGPEAQRRCVDKP